MGSERVWGTHRGLSFGEVDVCIQQHGDVLVSGLQRYGEGVTLVLKGGGDRKPQKAGLVKLSTSEGPALMV